MDIGIGIRNMGPQSTREALGTAARAAEAAGFESLWITDHIAIPPDDAEGSGGRYLDPLITLAWLAAQTSTIRLGTGVLILPYREPLTTAKLVATLQELSAGRLVLGVGIGWMAAEFRAVGRDLRHRARDSDATLRFLHDCFAADEVTANGQAFLFKPRPERPPFLVGGRAPHAIERALALGDGWMPMGRLERLRDDIGTYIRRGREQGQSVEVVAFASLPADDPAAARALCDEYAGAGVTRLVTSTRYTTTDELLRYIESVGETCARTG